MKIKIIDGYLHVGDTMVSATYKLFTAEGIDICIPKVNHPEPAPADPWVNPNGKVATIGYVNQRIFILLDSLAKRLDAVRFVSSRFDIEAGIFHAEKEQWK